MFPGEDFGRYLYHYTTVEIFLAHILPTLRLRLSPFSEVNDPRESKDWICTLGYDGAVPNDADFLDIDEQFNNLLKRSAKILCLTMDDPDMNSIVRRPHLLFGRGYSHSRMWDRYAGHHTGVCLAFDRQALDQEIASSLDGKGRLINNAVTYTDLPVAEVDAFNLKTSAIETMGMEGALRAHQEKHHRALYFFKSTEWATEFEYRWVLLSDQRGYEFVDVRQSLKGVTFGPDYPDDSISMVKQILDENCELTRLWYHNGVPVRDAV